MTYDTNTPSSRPTGYVLGSSSALRTHTMAADYYETPSFQIAGSTSPRQRGSSKLG